MIRRLLRAIVASGTFTAACQSGGEPPPPPPIGHLTAAPPWLSIEAGDTITGDTLRLSLFTDSGAPVPAGSVTWSSTNTVVAQVGATGLVRGLHPGVATINAMAASAQASVQITVTDPVLIGAGDMGTCSSTNDEATARLLDSLAGTVFTAGDNDYDDATLAPPYGVCFDSTWGRHKWRVRPAATARTRGAAGGGIHGAVRMLRAGQDPVKQQRWGVRSRGGVRKWAWVELNYRPHAYQACALTT